MAPPCSPLVGNTFNGGTRVDIGWTQSCKPAGVTAVPGPLTMAPPTALKDSYVRLPASQQIPDNMPVTVNSSGMFYLNNFSETGD